MQQKRCVVQHSGQKRCIVQHLKRTLIQRKKNKKRNKREDVGCRYHGDMEKQGRKRTPDQLALAEEGWQEIGASIAMAIVHGGKTKKWAWEILKPFEIYSYWMLDYWIEKCRNSNMKPNKTSKRGRRKVYIKSEDKSVFKTKEEVSEAFKLITKGADPKEVVLRYNKKSQT